MQQPGQTFVILAEKERSEAYTPLHQHLIKACRRGDRKAQFELYKLYNRSMYNTTLRIVGDPDDAEDVMQEAFLKAFTKLNTYRGEVGFGAWLKRIMINKALDFLRLKKKTISLDEVGEQEEFQKGVYEQSFPEPDSQDPVSSGLEVEKIKKAIYSLPEGYRIVLSLILLEGYDHEEVSGILGISNATSRTQYHRARKKLIELLKEKDVRR